MKHYKTGILGVGFKGTASVIVGGELRPDVVTEHGGMDTTLTLVHKLQQDVVSSVADPKLQQICIKVFTTYITFTVLRIRIQNPGFGAFLPSVFGKY
jgi:hypothetical protein